MKPKFRIKEHIVYYDPQRRRSWNEGGTWPHKNHYGFHEAVIAADFRLRGYEVIHDYSMTKTKPLRNVTNYFTKLVHGFVSRRATRFFTTELKEITGSDDGQPDLFVFHQDTPNDPKIRYPEYPENLLWFFVECKGPDEAIRETQRKFWRAIAERDNIDLGIKRLNLFRALPEGYKYEPKEYEF
ncbi:MAG: hypothetical protein COZ69_02400 [Deltaproteobacteria bacterium CG_4_8_14_3_um_filter_45_9]|nr:MAG: hypothetical protein COZ69_02400 [Deltaproteobacteria bacterium CG_4_8_14_3_um_filter_45_9]